LDVNVCFLKATDCNYPILSTVESLYLLSCVLRVSMSVELVCSPLTRTSAWCSMLPSSDDATHVYVAVWRTPVSCRTFLPIGVGALSWLATDGTSTEPRRQRTYGIGDPTATHVRLTAPPSITSMLSGRIEKCGGTRRTDETIAFLKPLEFRGNHDKVYSS